MKGAWTALLGGCALSLGATALAAQQPISRTPRAVGYVRGVVYDSLLKAPLDSARVYINGTTISDVTDAGGRFRLDGVPTGRQLIVFEHEALDSAGFTTNTRRIDIAPGRITVVDLAVPSLETVHRTACPTRLPPGARDSGVVFGMVTDIASGARLAGARVAVSWVRAGRDGGGRVQVTRPGLETRTDSVGNYYLCGVPTEYVVTAQAASGTFASGVTELLLGRRALARRDLAVSRDSTTLPDSSGLRRGRATLIGRVLDEHDQPRPSARAGIDDAVGEAYSDTAGQFVLRNMPPGSQMLMVRMVGYAAAHINVRLRDNDTSFATVRLHQITELDTLRITASTPQGQHEMEDLQARMRMGLGYFLTGEQVKRRQSMRAVFQGLPALMIEGPSVYRYQLETIVSGKVCPTTIFVDGFRADAESIQSYRPDQLVAVEWYPHGSQAPVKYQPAVNAECSVMLLWTRFIR